MKKRRIAWLLSILLLSHMIFSNMPGVFAQETTEEPAEEIVEEVIEEAVEEEPETEEELVVEEESTEESAEELTEEPVVEEEPVDEEIPAVTLEEPVIEEEQTDELTEEEPIEDTNESVFDQLNASAALVDFWQIMMSEENKQAVLDLTAEEIGTLRDKVNDLYDAIEGPTVDDTDYRDMLLETFDVLPNGNGELEEEPVVLPEVLTEVGTGNWQGGGILDTNTVWELKNGALVTTKEPITVPSGITLTIKGYGTFARYGAKSNEVDNKDPLFIVEEGGTLILQGNSDKEPVVIDGMGRDVTDKDHSEIVLANDSLIKSSGTLNFTNAVIQNGKNRSVYPEGHASAGKPNGTGGGIHVDATGSLTMENCIVTKNTASLNGGGINCYGPMTIKNSVISDNRAASAETGAVNAGRGGGFNLSGEKAVAVLENVKVENNAAMYYGGGGQITSKASLTMKDGTVFQNNKAILHGAGALHVTADSKFIMDGGSMINNTAQTVGGAIHSSYSCVLELNNGTISNNTANGRGGGVHINTGGALTLKSGIIISGNKVYDQPTGTYAEMDAAGDEWDNVKCEGPRVNNGYGGGVLIDSGTCKVEGAVIEGNTAAVGGGGIALVMLNASKTGWDDLEVVKFEMTSGKISGNSTDGNGAGVYLMSNRIKEYILAAIGKGEDSTEYQDAITVLKEGVLTEVPVAHISGGSVENNTAENNGGGLYLAEKTKFIISGTGTVFGNKAVKGAGVYIASGTAEIKGGTMSENEASEDGGALYVNGTVDMEAGEITENTAGECGGAVFAGTGGNITMSSGSINENKADAGGAIFADGGNITIEHGSLNDNTAYANGGAVYMAGSTNNSPVLRMESGEIKGNIAKGTKEDPEADPNLDPDKPENRSGSGSAIYTKNGTIYIGLERCTGPEKDDEGKIIDSKSNNDMHEALGENRHHPIIQGNGTIEFSNCGGGIAIMGKGDVHFYCGEIKDNLAKYPGVGNNLFMKDGNFYIYEGTNMGDGNDPGIVIIGGHLETKDPGRKILTLKYHTNNTISGVNEYTGYAEKDKRMNLPDGEYFFDAPLGYSFVGWTSKGNFDNETVRNKNQYIQSGDPIKITDVKTESDPPNMHDGTEDNTMHLYAIWAPTMNGITYVDPIANAVINDLNPDEYLDEYKMPDKAAGDVIHIPEVKKPGHKLMGWCVYQDEGQNANWSDGDIDYEPMYLTGAEGKDYKELDLAGMRNKGNHQYLPVDSNGDLYLHVPLKTFGDITLVAYYQELRDLTIVRENPCENDQIYVYKVASVEKPDFVIYVAVEADDVSTPDKSENEVTIRDLPEGTYTVEQINDWSWRNADEAEDVLHDMINLYPDDYSPVDDRATKVTFKDDFVNRQWLNGSSPVVKNTFGVVNQGV